MADCEIYKLRPRPHFSLYAFSEKTGGKKNEAKNENDWAPITDGRHPAKKGARRDQNENSTRWNERAKTLVRQQIIGRKGCAHACSSMEIALTFLTGVAK